MDLEIIVSVMNVFQLVPAIVFQMKIRRYPKVQMNQARTPTTPALSVTQQLTSEIVVCNQKLRNKLAPGSAGNQQYREMR